MNQQYRPTPTRREYEITCACGTVHHFKANNFDGVKCASCLAPLKMPPTVAAEGRQNENSQPEYTTKEEGGQ